MERSSRGAPLCPAGNLPLKGGDWMPLQLSPIVDVEGSALSTKPPISPLEGEISGRTEGGASR
ncbi:lytic murein transglycosylase [Mesorhizobium sp. B3-2-1]|nr:lytic murein transglycosylase [Mesorhizobium sp. B3-2-1]